MAERLGTFLKGVGGRLRALLKEIGPRGALAVTIVLLAVALLALPLAAIYVGVLSLRQEAAEQQATRGEEAPESRAEDFPVIFGPGQSSGLAEATSAADRRSRGIPGVSDMDIIGYLQHIPGTDFRCLGGTPTGEGPYKRTCRSSSGEVPAVYEVAVVYDARAVLSVVATARDVPDDEAAEVFGEVARLAVGGLGPLDPESFVERTISSGGQYLAEGAEVRLYGTEEARTLEIVATGPPAEEAPSEEPTPKTGQDGKDAAKGKATDSKKGDRPKADDKGR